MSPTQGAMRAPVLRFLLLLSLYVVACYATTDLRMRRVGGRASSLDIPDDQMTLPMDACPAHSSCCKATDGSLMRCPHQGGSCCAGDSSCCPKNHLCIKDASGASRCKKNSNVEAFRELGLESPKPASGNIKQEVKHEARVLQREQQEVAKEKAKLNSLKKEEEKVEAKVANAEAKADEKKIAQEAGGSDRGNLKVKAKMSNTGAARNSELSNGATVGGSGKTVSTSTMDIINHVIVDLHQSGPPSEEESLSS